MLTFPLRITINQLRDYTEVHLGLHAPFWETKAEGEGCIQELVYETKASNPSRSQRPRGFDCATIEVHIAVDDGRGIKILPNAFEQR